jgi:D-threo-aldose 1-dehydrogenase
MDWRGKVRLGRTELFVPRVGIGTAPLGNFLGPISDAGADAVLSRSVALGFRYFDTAPLYGHGLAERRVGRAVVALERDDVVVSTKVGRLLRSGAPPDETQYLLGEPVYTDVPEAGPLWDFSYDGVMSSVEESYERTGLDRFDILLLHDPDNHVQEASTSAYEALYALRSDGLVSGIGAGMNQSRVLTQLVATCDLDVVLVAGRYTLLDQSALDDLLPLCEERTVSVVVGGVFNSGILSDPSPGARYDYVPAASEVLRRAGELSDVCARYEVPLPAAALQFALAHPRVSTVLLGVRSIAELEMDVQWLDHRVPPELWEELCRLGLLRDDAPVPE